MAGKMTNKATIKAIRKITNGRELHGRGGEGGGAEAIRDNQDE